VRFTFSKSLRERLYREQRGRCYYCKRKLDPLGTYPGPRKDRPATSTVAANAHWLRESPYANHPVVEHRVPIVRGGTNDPSNLVIACHACNHKKGTRTEEEFVRNRRDPISRLMGLGVPINGIAAVLDVERQGYTGFNEPWPF
jgi:5-methylcytosine-specific restriction endonuclease McrA